MHLKPSQLKLTHLRDLAAGSIASIVGRESEIPLVLRLANTGENPKVMFLGGTHSFEVADWTTGEMMTTVVCEADELRVVTGHPDRQALRSAAGMMTLHEGGATIISARTLGTFGGTEFALSSWSAMPQSGGPTTLQMFPHWSFGKLNEAGDFVSFFQREHKSL